MTQPFELPAQPLDLVWRMPHLNGQFLDRQGTVLFQFLLQLDTGPQKVLLAFATTVVPLSEPARKNPALGGQ